MPPKKKPKFAYSHEDLLQAVQAVQNGESVNGASKKFNIPQSTLGYKVSGKTPSTEDEETGAKTRSNTYIGLQM